MKQKRMISTALSTSFAVLAILGAPLFSTTAVSQETTEARGTLWVANGMEDSLAAFDLSTDEMVADVPTGVNPHILDASPDGELIYVINAGAHDRGPDAHAGGGHGSESADTEGAERTENHKGTSTEMHGNANGSGSRAAAPQAYANSLWAIDARDGSVVARVPVGEGPTHPVVSPNGRWVYVTNTDGDSVSVIDTELWEVVGIIPDLPEPHDGAVSPDGSFLYLATSGSGTLTVVETKTREVVQSVPVGRKPRGVVTGGRNGDIIYVTNKEDGTLSVIEAPTGPVLSTVFVGRGAHAIRVSPDGAMIYVALSGEDSVAVLDSDPLRVLDKIPVGRAPEQIDLSRDGRRLFASNNKDSTVSIIDVQSGTVVQTVAAGKGVYGLEAVPISVVGGKTAAHKGADNTNH